MTKVYDQFDAATKGLQAYAILNMGKPVGRVIIKRASAVTAYVHLTGSQMARGQARGGGYDMATAAVRDAIAKLDARTADVKRSNMICALQQAEAAEGSGGRDWTSIVGTVFDLANVI